MPYFEHSNTKIEGTKKLLEKTQPYHLCTFYDAEILQLIAMYTTGEKYSHLYD